MYIWLVHAHTHTHTHAHTHTLTIRPSPYIQSLIDSSFYVTVLLTERTTDSHHCREPDKNECTTSALLFFSCRLRLASTSWSPSCTIMLKILYAASSYVHCYVVHWCIEWCTHYCVLLFHVVVLLCFVLLFVLRFVFNCVMPRGMRCCALCGLQRCRDKCWCSQNLFWRPSF